LPAYQPLGAGAVGEDPDHPVMGFSYHRYGGGEALVQHLRVSLVNQVER
jgi:hypothetical protein